MALRDHFDNTADVYRLSDESGDTEGYEIHLPRVPCVIQPLDDAYSQDMQGNFGKEFLMICLVCDIKEGDRVVADGNGHRVTAVDVYTIRGKNRQMELRIRRFND